MTDYKKDEETLSDAIEYLEKSKNIIENIKFVAEKMEEWEASEQLDIYIEHIQEVIDEISDIYYENEDLNDYENEDLDN